MKKPVLVVMAAGMGSRYGSIHALNENVNQGALPKAVDFYKTVIKKNRDFL